MEMYELCDEILNFCAKNKSIFYTGTLIKEYEKRGVREIQLEGALIFLSGNPPAYLSISARDIYILTPLGEFFASNGGYAEEKRVKQEERETAKQLNKSVLGTNDSVRRSHSFQKCTNIAMLVVVISAFLISLFNYLRNDDKLPILLLQQQQVKLMQEIDSLKFLIKQQASRDTSSKKHL
jgi:hypothetical protein